MSRDLDDETDKPRQAPLEYSEALQEWLSGIRSRAGGGVTHFAWETLLESLEQQLIAPVLALRTSVSDPVASNLLVVLANLLRQLHMRSAKLIGSQIHGANANVPLISGPQAEELKQLLVLNDHVLKLIESISQCKQAKNLAPRRRSR